METDKKVKEILSTDKMKRRPIVVENVTGVASDMMKKSESYYEVKGKGKNFNTSLKGKLKLKY